jgi:tetratricopeptide (TPR) repeat protein
MHVSRREACAQTKQTVVSFIVYPDKFPASGDLKKKMAGLRDRVRPDRRFIVLLYDPESPTFIMAAKTTLPETPLGGTLTATDKLALTKGAGVPFFIEMSALNRKADNVSIELHQVSSPDKMLWRWTGGDMNEAGTLLTDVILRASMAAEPPPTVTQPATEPSKPVVDDAVVIRPVIAPPATQPSPQSVPAPPAVAVAPPVLATAPVPAPAVQSPVAVDAAIVPGANTVTSPVAPPTTSIPAAPPSIPAPTPAPAPVAPPKLAPAPSAAMPTTTSPNDAAILPSPTVAPTPLAPAAIVAPPTPAAIPAPQPKPAVPTPDIVPSPVPPAPKADTPKPTEVASPTTATNSPGGMQVTVVPVTPGTRASEPATSPNAPAVVVVQSPPIDLMPTPAKPVSPAVTVDVTPITVAPAPTPLDDAVVAANAAPLLSLKDGARDHVLIGDEAHKKVIQGDSALTQADLFGAIDAYRQAVNLSPYATDIRLKLADVYVQAGYPAQGLDEARRALTLDSRSTAVADFIRSMKARGLVPNADMTTLLAAVARDPDGPAGWIELGDAYLAAQQPDKARDAYEHAVALQPAMPEPQARLVRLYVTTGQYDQALKSYNAAGASGYDEALRIVASRADTLLSDLHKASDDFTARTLTREGYYRALTTIDGRARSLSAFVSKMSAPQSQKVAYLHLMLGTKMVSQVTAAWVSFAETNDPRFQEQGRDMETEARREIKTAKIADMGRTR